MTFPLPSMRINAFGTNESEPSASAPLAPKGSLRLSNRPPPATGPARRKLRREGRFANGNSRELSARDVTRSMVIVGLLSARRCLLDGFANAQIGSAAADVAGHGVVDFGIRRMWVAGEQGRGRHDLTRLAVAALNYLAVDPGVLNFAANRCRADRLD